MRRHENALVSLDGMDGNLLERVQGKLVLACWLRGRDMRGDGNIRIAWRYGNLMSNLKQEVSGLMREKSLQYDLVPQL